MNKHDSMQYQIREIYYAQDGYPKIDHYYYNCHYIRSTMWQTDIG